MDKNKEIITVEMFREVVKHGMAKILKKPKYWAYKKDELTKRAIRAIRNFYKHKCYAGYSRSRLSSLHSGMAILQRFLASEFGVILDLQELQVS